MTESGEWQIKDESQKLDAFCVYNIIPESCSNCFNSNFCRYKENSTDKTEFVCPDMQEGENCETNLCSICLNGGYCANSDVKEEIQCFCPYPFEGENCERSKLKSGLGLYVDSRQTVLAVSFHMFALIAVIGRFFSIHLG